MPTWSKDTDTLAECVGQQCFVPGRSAAAALAAVDDCFLIDVSEAVQPRLLEQRHIGVEQVRAEGWISEHVVDAVIIERDDVRAAQLIADVGYANVCVLHLYLACGSDVVVGLDRGFDLAQEQLIDVPLVEHGGDVVVSIGSIERTLLGPLVALRGASQASRKGEQQFAADSGIIYLGYVLAEGGQNGKVSI